MSESIVDTSHVEEIVTQVLTQLVQDGGDEDQMSVEFLQEQVELNLEYSGETLKRVCLYTLLSPQLSTTLLLSHTQDRDF